MKKFILTLFILLSTALAISAHTVDDNESSAQKISIEFSIGVPPIVGMLSSVPYGHDDVDRDHRYQSGGWIADNNHMHHLNISLNWYRNHRWDFALMAGISGYTFTKYQYRKWVPEAPEDFLYERGSWVGGPDKVKGLHGDIGDVHLSAIWRVKYAYMPHAHLYSAFGFGTSYWLLYNGYVGPYLSPIGISVGEHSRIYGFAEATIGTGATFALAGIGIHL